MLIIGSFCFLCLPFPQFSIKFYFFSWNSWHLSCYFFFFFPSKLQIKSPEVPPHIYILKIQIQTSFLGIQTGKVASNKVLPADPPVNFHGILISISLGTENPASSSPTWTMWAEEKRKTIKILSQKPDKNSHFLLSFLCCACIQSLWCWTKSEHFLFSKNY